MYLIFSPINNSLKSFYILGISDNFERPFEIIERDKMWPTFFVLVGLLHPLLHVASAQVSGEACNTPRAEIGQCINIRSCVPLMRMLQTQGLAATSFLKASHCGFEDRDPMVCCPFRSGTDINADNNNQNPNQNQNQNQNQGNSNQNGPLPSPNYGPLYPPQCGFSNASHTRVVGGGPAKLGAWPWLAALGYRSKIDPSQTRWLCGGSLISARHVLTAAHCVFGRNDLYTVRLGDLILNSDADGAHPINVDIEKKIAHPRYSSMNYVNDVAILRLANDVQFTDTIYPICLPVADSIRSLDLVRKYPFIAGWGSVQYKGPASNQLMELQIPVVDNESCRKAFSRFSNAVIDNRTLCAGYARGGKDACQGDSGGPLMLPQGKYYYVVGVVSYGYQCAEPGYPGIYTRVTAFLNWIIDQLV